MVQTLAKSAVTTTGIDHVVLYVSDLARSTAFYTEVLGMTAERVDGFQARLLCGDQLIVLFQADGAVTTGAEINHLAFTIRSETREEPKACLESHGVAVSARPGDPTCVYFSDPDGHRLQLMVR
jgi:catechol 2,3-dioxygenase-like lactoylglutathione lyase family enzyme